MTTTIAPRLKRCTKCQQSKPTTEFRKYSRGIDGLAGSCKACARQKKSPKARRKKCARCKLSRNPGDFHPHGGRSDGLTRLCRHCHTLIAEQMFDARMRAQRKEKIYA